MRSKIQTLGLLLIAAILLGCSSEPPAMQLAYLPDVPQPPPRSDLPVDLRLKNWIGVDVDGDSGGSCVHASTRMVYRVSGEYELERLWHENRFEGPETAYRLLEKLDRVGVPFLATEDGDEELLEIADRTGRWATIFYYPSHSIAFCGYEQFEGEECAFLLDNNFPDQYIVVPKGYFLDSWKHAYTGFAMVPWINPPVARSFPRTYAP
jgi:hypothetical protein